MLRPYFERVEFIEKEVDFNRNVQNLNPTFPRVKEEKETKC